MLTLPTRFRTFRYFTLPCSSLEAPYIPFPIANFTSSSHILEIKAQYSPKHRSKRRIPADTVRARRFPTWSRPNFQTFCTLGVRNHQEGDGKRRTERGRARDTTRDIFNRPFRPAAPPDGPAQPLQYRSQSLDPEQTKGRYILPLCLTFHPFSATPSTPCVSVNKDAS